MAKDTGKAVEGKQIFVGVDLHKRTWHVTIRTREVELWRGSMPASWPALRKTLSRYPRELITVVYEAGYLGFSLFDALTAWGAQCQVTPPSLIPVQAGNRVKTDKRDSRKLAQLLAAGLLSAVWVPSPEQRAHRQVVRTRRQLVHDRTRIQLRIKSLLTFYGLAFPTTRGKWSQTYVQNLRCVRLEDRWGQASLEQLWASYELVERQVTEQTQLLRALAATEPYCTQLRLLRTVPGIGDIVAMEVLLELGDITRFSRSKTVGAYVGLTPSQHSSGEHVCLGHITHTGKATLRALLVQAAWRTVTKDPALGARYETLKARRGGKRAIVGIARQLLGRIRHILLAQEPYVLGVTS